MLVENLVANEMLRAYSRLLLSSRKLPLGDVINYQHERLLACIVCVVEVTSHFLHEHYAALCQQYERSNDYRDFSCECIVNEYGALRQEY